MNWKLVITVPFALLLFLPAHSQCKVNNRLFPEGSLYYFTEAVLIYKTPERELLGTVVTDRELFFLALLPKPFPEEKIGRKFKKDLAIKFEDKVSMTLEHFDSRYLQGDTAFVIMYQIPKDSLGRFTEYDISSLSSELYDGTGIKNYNLVLHKNAIMDQLKCLMKKTAKKEDDGDFKKN